MKSRILMSMAFASGLAVLDVGAATEVSSVADLYAAFISPADGEEIVLAADPSGASTRITALADQNGPGFKNMAAGDWSLKKASVLVDGGVLYDGIASARDLAGHPRCLRFGAVDPAALPDIGCYEFYSIPGLTIRLR